MTGISVNGAATVSDKSPLDAVFDIQVGMTYVPKYLAKALFSQGPRLLVLALKVECVQGGALISAIAVLSCALFYDMGSLDYDKS